jgi:hypothetical protein
LGQTAPIEKPARTPGFVAGFTGWLASGVAIAVRRNVRSSQGVLPMFIEFGHACVNDEDRAGSALLDAT